MEQLIQEFLLSDVVIGLFMTSLILGVTRWSFILREYTGYALGWLVGIFLIIILSTVLPSSNRDILTTASEPVQLNFFGLLIPSVLGLIIGFFLVSLIRAGSASTSRIRRALTIAFLVSFLVCSTYFMLTSDRSTRIWIAMFLLTFGIGLLLNTILARTVHNPVVIASPTEAQMVNDGHVVNASPFAPTNQPLTPSQQLRNFRERLRRQ
ncbi:MAG: hypothetical protein K8L97_29680 [Anaerolineae bacterium]|nr:hypothetical protein [Anaerolineae bacterium]